MSHPMVIYKYHVPLGSETEITLEYPLKGVSGSGQAVSIAEQDGKLFVWLSHLKDPEYPYGGEKQKVRVRWFGTGHDIPPEYEWGHLGTVHLYPYVWHLFIKTEDPCEQS